MDKILKIKEIRRVSDHSLVKDFGDNDEMLNWMEINCSLFGKSIVYNKDGSVVHIKRTQVRIEDRIGTHYERVLAKLANNRIIRMLVIEDTCRIPKINPIDMAKCLKNRGYQIVFDDSSITTRENEYKRRLVYGKEVIK